MSHIQQRTTYSNQQAKNAAPAGMVTLAAFGARHVTEAGRSVEDTLREHGLTPEDWQVARVNARAIHDLSARILEEGDTVTLTNVVRGG